MPDLVETIGYVAAGLVFAAFYMKTMVPLRMVAIGSNVAFILYGYLVGSAPVMILHTILLPLNVQRLTQIRRLLRRIGDGRKTDIPIDTIIPLMTRAVFKAGEVVMRKGDRSDRVYYLVNGQVLVKEFDVRLQAGTLFGEIGIFAEDRRRTATVLAETDCEALFLTYEQMTCLYFQNPLLGLAIIRLVTTRLVRDVGALEALVADSARAAATANGAGGEDMIARGVY